MSWRFMRDGLGWRVLLSRHEPVSMPLFEARAGVVAKEEVMSQSA